MADRTVLPNVSRRSFIGISALLLAGAKTLHANARGTPVPPDATGPARLTELLALIPASIGEQAGFGWNDVSRQVASLGVEMPTGLPTSISAAYEGAISLLPAGYAQRSPLDATEHERLGYSEVTAHQILSIYTDAFPVQMLRGGLPLDSLPGIWAAAGYAREASPEGVDIWTIPDPPRDGRASPIVWHLAIVGDTLVTAQGYAEDTTGSEAHRTVAAIVTQASAAGASLLDLHGFKASIDALSPDVVGVLGLPGTGFEVSNLGLAPPGDDLANTPAQQVIDDPNQVPPPLGVICAITGGASGGGSGFDSVEGTSVATPAIPVVPDPGDATVQVRMGFESEAEANQAATTIELRWTSWESARFEQPYAELLSLESATTVSTIAAFDLRPTDNPTMWLGVFGGGGDRLPFAYVERAPAATPGG